MRGVLLLSQFTTAGLRRNANTTGGRRYFGRPLAGTRFCWRRQPRHRRATALNGRQQGEARCTMFAIACAIHCRCDVVDVKDILVLSHITISADDFAATCMMAIAIIFISLFTDSY